MAHCFSRFRFTAFVTNLVIITVFILYSAHSSHNINVRAFQMLTVIYAFCILSRVFNANFYSFYCVTNEIFFLVRFKRKLHSLAIATLILTTGENSIVPPIIQHNQIRFGRPENDTPTYAFAFSLSHIYSRAHTYA